MITLLDSVVLGVVEGLTEFLPVSSTGHLILVDRWLAGAAMAEAEKAARDAFDVVIQFGALLAVVIYYRKLLWEMAMGLPRRDAKAWRLAAALGIAFLPAAVAGLLFHHWIKAHLFGVKPVAAALAVGGILMIAVEKLRSMKGAPGLSDLSDVTPGRALAIGCAQCAALWPGTSRSMATIVGGQLSGLSTSAAAEFSFLLSLPTLGAACLYDMKKSGALILKAGDGPLPLIVGLFVSAVVAYAVIGGFLAYLKRRGLAPFGVYRIVLAGVVLWLVS